MYRNVNPHPQGKRTRDCVKRALCLGSEINYHDIAIMLNRYRKETHAKAYNYDENWRPFIVKVLLGVDLGNLQYANHGHRYKVYEFAKQRNTRAICQVANHLVAVNGEGDYLDTWNSGEKSIYKAYGLPSYEVIVSHIKTNYKKLCKGLTLERQKMRFVL